MTRFEFNDRIISSIIAELELAEDYIKIAIFQLHNIEIFETLSDKLRQGIRIEIFTLPYDSINQNIRDEVIPRFENLRNHGAVIYFCKWNIGDPERTSTAVGKWYSFHGKFIITDKTAICLSANFTENSELDAFIVFNEVEKIRQFNDQFDALVNMFVLPQENYEGTIRQQIMSEPIENVIQLFNLPQVIETDTHLNNWITDYPSSMCPSEVSIENKLYIVPFDGKGRDIIESVIGGASNFVYISAESFTDQEFPQFLSKVVATRQLDLRILCGAKSMDFTDRINNMFRELLARGISVRTRENLHAKLVITDSHLVVSSINLNKMNLGFARTTRLWRENTETLLICSDPEIISIAKSQYVSNFDNSTDIRTKLTEKIETYVSKMFTSTFNLKTRAEVKSLLSKHILEKEVEVKRTTWKVGKIASKMMERSNRKMVGKDDILSALILYYLSESKLNSNQLLNKLSDLEEQSYINELLGNLLRKDMIEMENEFYKIKIERLF